MAEAPQRPLELADIEGLDFGRTLAEGTPAEMQAHPEVIRAYLGAPT